MAPRLTAGKVKRWQSDIDKAQVILAKVEADVRAQSANPMAKHYQPLADVRSPLSRAMAWAALTDTQIARLRP